MPVDFRGKDYFTVAERLKMAYGEDFSPPVGIQQISTRMEDHAGIVVILAEIVFADGRRFTGMSAVKSSSNSPAERDAPVETCETSAVGRALAMAGYFGSPEGIAGYEELHLAQQRAEARTQAPGPRFADGSSPVTRMPSGSGAGPRPAGGGGGGGPSPAQTRYLNQLWEQAGRPFPPPEPATGREASNIIDELRTELGIPPRQG